LRLYEKLLDDPCIISPAWQSESAEGGLRMVFAGWILLEPSDKPHDPVKALTEQRQNRRGRIEKPHTT
jgi:hypothetical protein